MSVGVLPPTSSTNSFLFGIIYGASQRRNVLAHADILLDEMIVEQSVESDPDRRGEFVRGIQRYLLQQAYAFSPVTGGDSWVSLPKVRGLYPNTAASEYFHWATTWLEP